MNVFLLALFPGISFSWHVRNLLTKSNPLYHKTCTKVVPSTTTNLHTVLPSTTLHCKACTKYFPEILCTTKLAQSTSQDYCTTKLAQNTSQYYFVLQTLHTVVALHRSSKVAQSTSQYNFVLQSLHKALPSTTLFYKGTKYFPVLHSTAKLTQSTSQYYVLQSLHNMFLRTTSYYKVWTKWFRTTLYYKAPQCYIVL